MNQTNISIIQFYFDRYIVHIGVYVVLKFKTSQKIFNNWHLDYRKESCLSHTAWSVWLITQEPALLLVSVTGAKTVNYIYTYMWVLKPCIEYMDIFTPSLFLPLSSHQEANFTSFFFITVNKKSIYPILQFLGEFKTGRNQL